MHETFAALERDVNAIATALFGTEEFVKTTAVLSDIQLKLQNAMESHMARQLARFNLPSRADITALGERIMTIDERLIRIEEKLRRIDPKQNISQSDRPPRTKKPEPQRDRAVSKPAFESTPAPTKSSKAD